MEVWGYFWDTAQVDSIGWVTLHHGIAYGLLLEANCLVRGFLKTVQVNVDLWLEVSLNLSLDHSPRLDVFWRNGNALVVTLLLHDAYTVGGHGFHGDEVCSLLT